VQIVVYGLEKAASSGLFALLVPGPAGRGAQSVVGEKKQEGGPCIMSLRLSGGPGQDHPRILLVYQSFIPRLVIIRDTDPRCRPRYADIQRTEKLSELVI
jgi:hypothetical protein